LVTVAMSAALTSGAKRIIQGRAMEEIELRGGLG
jgi:hypothetical protein